MISEEKLNALNESTVEGEWPLHQDVVVDGQEKTALFFEEEWFLVPVNFKFGNDNHHGQPYLSMDRELIEVVTADYLSTLKKWTYDHTSGRPPQHA